MPPCARRSCRSSPSRRAFFVPFLRWLGRFDTGGVEYATFCPLVPAVLHLAGVHFSFCFSTGLIVSTLPAGNFVSFCPPAAANAHLAGVHFSSRFSAGWVVSTVPAENLPPCARRPCRCLPSRRAFFVPFLRWLGPFDCAGGEFAIFCRCPLPMLT